MAELLVWPALVAYGEAAVAYGAEARRPGAAGRLAIWGVRIGWLAQTALLLGQAIAAGAFPWSSWAGALNLLSWLVVGAYLIWGCRPRYRLLGLGVMPVAALLLALAYVGGGTAAEGDHPGVLLATHVALMLAGLAGMTLAAGLAALYLWHERRLKRRERTILRLRVPPLQSLDTLVVRTVVVSLATLTLGILVGLAAFASGRGGFDAAMAATLGAWLAYASFLALRGRGFHGRRSAQYVLTAFLLVVLVLPVTHYAS